jgi:hypothetical protein
MTTYEADAAPIVVKDPSEALPAKIGRAVAKLPRHNILMLGGVLWLMPTLGRFFE